MTKKTFLFLQIATITLGLIFLIWSQTEYDSILQTHKLLDVRHKKLSEEKAFKLTTKADSMYQKIFNSSLNTHNLIHTLQGTLEKIALKHGLILEEIKIKKQEEVSLMSNFLFSLKMKGHDDRAIYDLIQEIEQLDEIFTISKSLSLKKEEKAHKPSIEGEYVFEVYIKS